MLVGAYRVERIRAPIPPRAPESAREKAKLAFVCTGLRCARGGRTAHSSPEPAALESTALASGSSSQWCIDTKRIGKGH